MESSNRLPPWPTFAALAIALLLGGLSIGLQSAWPSMLVTWPWLALSVGMALVVWLTSTRTIAISRISTHATWLGNAWPWLIAALLMVGLTPVIGFTELGATRWLGGESFHIRTSLWGMVLLLVFLAVFAKAERPGWVQQGLVMLGLAVIAVLALKQPDLFSIVVLALLGLFIGFKANNALRLWLPGSVMAGGVLGFIALRISPYRWERFIGFWTIDETDPLGAGYTLRQSYLAFEQAGWWGQGVEPSSSGIATLATSVNWYALPYLSLWLGNAVSIAAVVLVLLFAGLIYRQSRSMPDAPMKMMVQGGVLIFLVDHLFAFAAPLGLLPYTGHFGTAFLGGGEMSVAALLLLWAVNCRPELHDAAPKAYRRRAEDAPGTIYHCWNCTQKIGLAAKIHYEDKTDRVYCSFKCFQAAKDHPSWEYECRGGDY